MASSFAAVMDVGAERRGKVIDAGHPVNLGVRGQAAAAAARGGMRSGDESEALVGADELISGRPSIENAHDTSTCPPHEACSGVPQGPAQTLWVGADGTPATIRIPA